MLDSDGLPLSSICENSTGLHNKKGIIECLLFVSAEPQSAEKISQIVEISLDETKLCLLDLAKEYEQKGIVLREKARGWQFVTLPDYAPYVEKLYRPKQQALSKAKLETLAIIAYKQPMTRQDIEGVRRVNSDSIVSSLMDSGLIREVGRRDSPGRPILYGTTNSFLDFFGLKSLDDLPALSQFMDSLDNIDGLSDKESD